MTNLSLLIDPAALSLVGLGSLTIALVQNGSHTAGAALTSVRAVFRRNPEQIRERSRLATVIMGDVVEKRGVACADRAPKSCPFTYRLGMAMSDAPTYDHFARAVSAMLDKHADRRRRAVRFWNDVADAAPALGMLGTIIGLIQLFAGLETAEGIGLGMAICLLTSLYGLLFAHVIAGPLARRLELVAEEEALWQTDSAEKMLAIARREFPDGALRIASRDGVRDMDLRDDRAAATAQTQ